MKKFTVTSTQWQGLGPVKSIESDHRIAIDIDSRGWGWVRLLKRGEFVIAYYEPQETVKSERK
jgi:hypothetical protein